MNEPPASFDRYLRRAERLVGEPGKLKAVIGKAGMKLATSSNAKLSALRTQLELSLALLKDWVLGNYRHVELRTVVVLAAGVLYFVVPLDAIPDFLLGWGLVDDVAVLGYVFAQLQNELAVYAAWRQAQPPVDSADATAAETADTADKAETAETAETAKSAKTLETSATKSATKNERPLEKGDGEIA